MKYNQELRKEYLENELNSLLIFIGMDPETSETVTFKDIRSKLNQVYPAVTLPGVSTGYPAEEALIRERRRIFNFSRHLLYELNAIRNRVNNASW